MSFKPGDVVLAEVVILVQDTDLGGGLLLQR